MDFITKGLPKFLVSNLKRKFKKTLKKKIKCLKGKGRGFASFVPFHLYFCLFYYVAIFFLLIFQEKWQNYHLTRSVC